MKHLLILKKISIAGLIVGFWASISFAQVDASAALLLRNRGSSAADDQLDSSRYTVRPSVGSSSSRSRRDEARTPKAASPVAEKKFSNDEKEEILDSLLDRAEGIPPVADTSDELEKKEEQNLTEQVKEFVMGGDEKDIQQFKNLLHSNDPRKNIVEISLAPGYFYQNSDASYFYRNYFSQSPSFNISAQIWLTPFFGVNTDYFTSLGADIRANAANTKKAKVDHQNFSLGFRTRIFSGISRKASRINLGIDYDEYDFKVPADEVERISTKTTGVRLSVEGLIPSSHTYAWLLGADYIPKANHKEIDTALSLKSGDESENNVVGIWVGGRFTIDRQNQLYWKLKHRVEKYNYKGPASLADPISGNTPEGVSVTNGITQFQLGYTFGN